LQNRRFCLADPTWQFYRHHNFSHRTANLSYVDELFEKLDLRTAGCPAGEYSELGSLLHNSWHSAIGVLFSTGTYHVLGPGTLVIFLLFFFLLACLTAGSSVAAGLVIPMLAIGGTVGRLAGVLVNMGIKQSLGLTAVDPGPWAMVGAAAFWSGSGRITVTIAVIMLEITGDFRYLPPMAVAVALAKILGDRINHGLYHEMIHLKHIPFLEDDVTGKFEDLQVKSVMQSPVVFLRERDTVSNIQSALATSHNGFPVVATAADATDTAGAQQQPETPANTFIRVTGLVLRGDLEALLPAGIRETQASRLNVNIASAMNETPAIMVESTLFSEAHRQETTIRCCNMTAAVTAAVAVVTTAVAAAAITVTVLMGDPLALSSGLQPLF